jgi:hypothetical protein
MVRRSDGMFSPEYSVFDHLEAKGYEGKNWLIA